MLGRNRQRRPGVVAGFEELCTGPGTEGPFLAVCGERLEAPERAALATRLAAGAPGVGVIVVERLCDEPSALRAALARRDATALVVAGCDHVRAAAAVREAVSAGLDTARTATVSLAPVAPDARLAERAPLLEAICLAGARKAAVLAGEPLAGRQRLQLRGGLSRRALLTPWRDAARHTAVLDEDRCVGTPRCGACLAACGELALRVEGGALHVDPLRCTSCGRCVPSCPTGALSLPGAALAGIAAELQTLRAEGIDALALTCEHSPASFTPTSERGAEEPAVPVALPCLAMATPGLVLGLLAGGARVELAPCARCPNGHALTHVVGFVERLLHALGRPDLRARLSLPGGSPQAAAVDASDERSAPPPGTLARPAPPGALGLREPMATHGAVVALLDEPGGTRLADEAMFDGGAPGGVVRVESARCSLCGACALACPTAAIALRREDRELIVDAARCLGCGRCAGACPEDAVHVTRGVDLLAGRAGPTALRLPVASWTCAGCGAAVDEDPILAPVAARLAAAGASAALVAGLRRCPSCGAQRLGGAPRLEPAGPGA